MPKRDAKRVIAHYSEAGAQEQTQRTIHSARRVVQVQKAEPRANTAPAHWPGSSRRRSYA